MVAGRLAGATVVAMVAALTANIRGEPTMRIRTDRLYRRSMMIVAALFGLTLMSLPAAAQGSPEQRAACQDDAMRLCNQYVPDVNRITACMSQKRRYLSPRCRAVFGGGAKKKRAGN
jgi:type II secretory pathway component PulL